MKLKIYSTGVMSDITPNHFITIGNVLKYIINEKSIISRFNADIEIDEDFFTVTLDTTSKFGNSRTLQFGFSPSGFWFEDYECTEEEIYMFIDKLRD